MPAEEWVVKESKTHPGYFYQYNNKTGESIWLTNTGKAPVGTSASRTSHIKQGGSRSGSLQLPAAGKGSARPITPLKLRKRGGAQEIPWDKLSRVSQDMYSECPSLATDETLSVLCVPLESAPFQGSSRYREDYPEHPIQPKGKATPRAAPSQTIADPEHFKTKYEEDFPVHVSEPPQSMKPVAAPIPHMPFDGTTTNREMFAPQPVKPVQRRRPPSPMRVEIPFEGTTTNREAFAPHPESRPSKSLAPPVKALAKTPFYGTTSYQKQFQPHEIDVTSKPKIEHPPYDYGPPRNLATEHRQAFTPKEVKKKKKCATCPPGYHTYFVKHKKSQPSPV
eukprot:TRINITY_DN77713_c0_g1_i1.p1 TRINITY_DN77713_c0_g1~~TRINITY_DN77713_c0_g1_i1.p1  ORF type:complete len:336 (-),score=25.47 TRINITY_DN77713_c0_g1_i1:121-1128(-)